MSRSGGAITDAYATGAVSGVRLRRRPGRVRGRRHDHQRLCDRSGQRRRRRRSRRPGRQQSDGTITDAYATGAVSGGVNGEVGGLVGAAERRHDQQRLCDRGGQRQQRRRWPGRVCSPEARSPTPMRPGRSAGGYRHRRPGRREWARLHAHGRLLRHPDHGPDVGRGRGHAADHAQLQGLVRSRGACFSSGFSTRLDLGLRPRALSLPESFFPNGVQAVSGTAYTNAGTTAAASGRNGAVTVNLDAGGALLAQATTGANGYYYIALPGRDGRERLEPARLDAGQQRRGARTPPPSRPRPTARAAPSRPGEPLRRLPVPIHDLGDPLRRAEPGFAADHGVERGRQRQLGGRRGERALQLGLCAGGRVHHRPELFRFEPGRHHPVRRRAHGREPGHDHQRR